MQVGIEPDILELILQEFLSQRILVLGSLKMGNIRGGVNGHLFLEHLDAPPGNLSEFVFTHHAELRSTGD